MGFRRLMGPLSEMFYLFIITRGVCARVLWEIEIKNNKKLRGHEGIEPSTSPTLKENHTTRPMAHAWAPSGSRSAVNRVPRGGRRAVLSHTPGNFSLEACLQSSVGRAVGC